MASNVFPRFKQPEKNWMEKNASDTDDELINSSYLADIYFIRMMLWHSIRARGGQENGKRYRDVIICSLHFAAVDWRTWKQQEKNKFWMAKKGLNIVNEVSEFAYFFFYSFSRFSLFIQCFCYWFVSFLFSFSLEINDLGNRAHAQFIQRRVE